MSNMHANTVSLQSGIILSFGEAGRSSGIPLVLLHGYTDSWRSFEPLARHLPRSLRMIGLSQRGHGDSSKPLDGYSVAQFAKDTHEALDRLRIPRCLVVGHCMGSLVAAHLAAHAPDRIEGLVLIGAMRSLCRNPVCQELWSGGVEAMTDPVDPGFVREFQESTVTRPVSGDFMDQVVEESLKVPAHVWRSTLRSLLEVDSAALPHRIKAPTCIIWGDQDGLTLRAEQQALVSVIRNSTLIVHEGTGHAPHWEAPGRVAGEVVAWMRQTLATAA